MIDGSESLSSHFFSFLNFRFSFFIFIFHFSFFIFRQISSIFHAHSDPIGIGNRTRLVAIWNIHKHQTVPYYRAGSMSDMPSLDMADAKSNSLILEAFDLFLSDVNTALAIKSFLEEENKALKYEVDLLTAEAKKKDEILAGKEEEIGRLLERNLSSTRSHTLIISETKNEIRASAQLVEMRYEVREVLRCG